MTMLTRRITTILAYSLIIFWSLSATAGSGPPYEPEVPRPADPCRIVDLTNGTRTVTRAIQRSDDVLREVRRRGSEDVRNITDYTRDEGGDLVEIRSGYRNPGESIVWNDTTTVTSLTDGRVIRNTYIDEYGDVRIGETREINHDDGRRDLEQYYRNGIFTGYRDYVYKSSDTSLLDYIDNVRDGFLRERTGYDYDDSGRQVYGDTQICTAWDESVEPATCVELERHFYFTEEYDDDGNLLAHRSYRCVGEPECVLSSSISFAYNGDEIVRSEDRDGDGVADVSWLLETDDDRRPTSALSAGSAPRLGVSHLRTHYGDDGPVIHWNERLWSDGFARSTDNYTYDSEGRLTRRDSTNVRMDYIDGDPLETSESSWTRYDYDDACSWDSPEPGFPRSIWFP